MPNTPQVGMSPELLASMSPVEKATLMLALMADATDLRGKLKFVDGRIAQVRIALKEQLSQSEQKYVKVPGSQVNLVWRSRAEVSDPSAFHAHILRSGELDLLENRPSTSAIRERWEVGDSVPGIVRVDYEDLSITREPK